MEHTPPLHPYRSYRPSGVEWLGDVPEHWDVRRIKTFLRERDERGDDGNRELLSLTRTQGLVPQAQASERIALTDNLVNHKVCSPGDLIMNRMQAWSGMFAIASQEGLVSPDYCVLQPVGTSYDMQYFERLFKVPAIVGAFARYSKGIGSGFNRLYTPDLGRIAVSVPTRTEQRAITGYLDYVDRHIRRYVDAKRKLIELLEEERQAVVNQAVTRGLDRNVRLKPSGVEWLGDMPEHWEVRPLKRVLHRLIDCEHKTAPAVNASSYRVVRTSAVRGGSLVIAGTYCTSEEAFAEWTRRGAPEPGDVIFTREAPAGEACVVPGDLSLCLGQRTVLMKVDRSAYEPHFLVHMLYAGPSRDEMELASRGSTVPHFNVEDIGVLPVLAPPVSEQTAIVGYLAHETAAIDTTIDRLGREIELIEEYRTRLVADVVTGKLDVRGAEAQLLDEEGDDWREEARPGDFLDDDRIPEEPSDGLTIESEVAR